MENETPPPLPEFPHGSAVTEKQIIDYMEAIFLGANPFPGMTPVRYAPNGDAYILGSERVGR